MLIMGMFFLGGGVVEAQVMSLWHDSLHEAGRVQSSEARRTGIHTLN